MPTFRNPKKGDWVHYVLTSNAHRPAMIVRVFPATDDALMPDVDLQVFLDGRNDSIEGVCNAWIAQAPYEQGMPVLSWHWADACVGHEND